MGNPVLEACQAELKRQGVEHVDVEHTGSGHLKLAWEDKDVVLPSTPSDWRAPKNAVSTLRKISRGAYSSPTAPVEEERATVGPTEERVRQPPHTPYSTDRTLAVPIAKGGERPAPAVWTPEPDEPVPASGKTARQRRKEARQSKPPTADSDEMASELDRKWFDAHPGEPQDHLPLRQSVHRII